MLIGQHVGKVGEKHQTALPKKFREELGSKLVVTKGLEKNLIIVSEENWKTLLEGTEGRPFTDKNSREVQRYLLGNASIVELDAQGRFVIPEYLRKYAGIDKEIVFAGIQRFIEVWDVAEWEKEQEKLSQNIASLTEKLTQSEKTNE